MKISIVATLYQSAPYVQEFHARSLSERLLRPPLWMGTTQSAQERVFDVLASALVSA